VSASNWTPAEVAGIYDHSTPTADMFGDGYEHLGYWYDDGDDASVGAGSARLTRKIVDTLDLRAGEHLLDAGCGTGATAEQIAREYGATVTGVTISPVGLGMAEKRANASEVGGRLRFELGDYHAMRFPENHFDALIAVESLMHAVDLDKALLEFHRVLRPGGRLAIAETTKARPDARITMSYSRDPMMAGQWVEAVTAAGFVAEEWIECGHRVFGQSGKRFAEHADNVREEFVAQFGTELFDGIKQAQSGWFAMGTDHVSYLILCARKPG
jgi:ubiquinone/menaquinone biosynthesis C-methylase UbiE